jgi:DNA-binding IscR family transcriptional regulator
VLQALVREGILKGVRGPRGGYELARERRRITVDDILKAASTGEDDDDTMRSGSSLLEQVVTPAVAQAEKVFVGALNRITIEELARRAEPFVKSTGES